MCRTGGRRCPNQRAPKSDAFKAKDAARKRAERAAKRGGGDGTPTPTALLAAAEGIDYGTALRIMSIDRRDRTEADEARMAELARHARPLEDHTAVPATFEQALADYMGTNAHYAALNRQHDSVERGALSKARARERIAEEEMLRAGKSGDEDAVQAAEAEYEAALGTLTELRERQAEVFESMEHSAEHHARAVDNMLIRSLGLDETTGTAAALVEARNQLPAVRAAYETAKREYGEVRDIIEHADEQRKALIERRDFLKRTARPPDDDAVVAEFNADA